MADSAGRPGHRWPSRRLRRSTSFSPSSPPSVACQKEEKLKKKTTIHGTFAPQGNVDRAEACFLRTNLCHGSQWSLARGVAGRRRRQRSTPAAAGSQCSAGVAVLRGGCEGLSLRECGGRASCGTERRLGQGSHGRVGLGV